MIPSYRLLANRIRHELDDLAKVVQRAEDAVTRAKQSPADQDFFSRFRKSGFTWILCRHRAIV